MKIKYLLLSLLTPLLVSFCSADFNASSVFQLVQSWNLNSSNLPNKSNWKYLLYNVNNDYTRSDSFFYCVYNKINLDSNYEYDYQFNYTLGFFVWSSFSNYFQPISYTFDYNSSITAMVFRDKFFHCARPNRLPYDNNRISIWYNSSSTTNTFISYLLSWYINIDYSIYKVSESDYFSFLQSSNSSSDCSSVESQLSSCQSSLESCQSNGSHCDTLYWVCVENLSWCNADKLSLQNYNDSLSSQLNECLANSDWTWELLTWDCLQNSLFWLDNENMLSLPITNNLFLPNGYWGYLTTWNVLWISSLEDHSKVYEFDSWAKETTVNSIAYIMLFLIATWLIMVLLRFLKRLFKL